MNIKFKRIIFISYEIELKSVFVKSFILGYIDNVLKGLISLNILIAEKFVNPGIVEIIAVTTTIKSSTFHPSLK